MPEGWMSFLTIRAGKRCDARRGKIPLDARIRNSRPKGCFEQGEISLCQYAPMMLLNQNDLF